MPDPDEILFQSCLVSEIAESHEEGRRSFKIICQGA